MVQKRNHLSSRTNVLIASPPTGRITLDEYELVYKTENQETQADETEKDAKDNGGFNDFDFDEDLETNLTKQSPLLKKKPTQGEHSIASNHLNF